MARSSVSASASTTSQPILELSGTVEKRYYTTSQKYMGVNGFFGIYKLTNCTVKGKMGLKSAHIKCSSCVFVETGDVISGHFHEITDPTYGKQYESVKNTILRVSLPTDEAAIRKRLNGLAKSIAGIGTQKVAKLVREQGPAHIWDKLQPSGPPRLLPLSVDETRALRKQFADYTTRRGVNLISDPLLRLTDYLHGLGIEPMWPESLRRSIINHFIGESIIESPRDVVDELRKNPFSLIQVEGVGMGRFMTLIQSMELGSDQVTEATLLGLFETMTREEGHMAYPLADLLTRAEHLYPKQAPFRPVFDRLQVKKVLYLDEPSQWVWMKDVWSLENRIHEDLHHLSTTIRPPSFSTASQTLTTPETTSITLNEQQHAALEIIPRHTINIITGAPGTGKTTLLHTLIRSLAPGSSILMMAPTGKAVARMEESVAPSQTDYTIRFCTVHKWMYAFMNKKEGKATNPQPESGEASFATYQPSCIIIDETSMVDSFLLSQIFHIIRTKLRPHVLSLLFLGDPNQLPSVGSGDVLRGMIARATDFSIGHSHLTHVHRQTGTTSSLVRVLSALQQDPANPILRQPKEDSTFSYLTETSIERAVPVVLSIATKFKKENKPIMFLTPIHKNIKLLLEPLRDIFNPPTATSTTPPAPAHAYFRKGDRVFQTKNDYNGEEPIYNGMTGTIIDVQHEQTTQESEDNGSRVAYTKKQTTYRVLFDNGRQTVYEDEEAARANLQLAYITTVHKAQGSEAERVLVLLTGCSDRFLNRNLLITAISRAKKRCIVIGEPSALARGASRILEHRYSLFFADSYFEKINTKNTTEKISYKYQEKIISVHNENGCSGNIILYDSIGCKCNSCENWLGGCSDPTYTYYYKCDKCEYKYIERVLSSTDIRRHKPKIC